MSDVQATQAILEALQRAYDEHTEYELQIDAPGFCNVDRAMQEHPYLKVEIKFLTADQADLGTSPTVKQWGQVWVSAVQLEGRGWLEPTKLIEHVRQYVELKRLGIVTTLAAGALPPKTVKGEEHRAMIVNFYYHRQT